jgi:hypothetical protein
LHLFGDGSSIGNISEGFSGCSRVDGPEPASFEAGGTHRDLLPLRIHECNYENDKNFIRNSHHLVSACDASPLSIISD